MKPSLTVRREPGFHHNTVQKHFAEKEFPRYNKGPLGESIRGPYVQAIEDSLEEPGDGDFRTAEEPEEH